MKKTFLSIILLLLAMVAQAQGMIIASYHYKVNSAPLSLDSSPEDVVDYVIKSTGKNYALMPGLKMVPISKKTDAYGNIHVGYGMEFNGNLNASQTFLHFHPDGTLYYINGIMPLQDLDAPFEFAKSQRKKIPAERASLIATGKTTSEVVLTIVNYKNEPRLAYKVNDPGALQEVYVDVYSGEVLYTISQIMSFAPWDDVHGTNVSVLANTMYYGMQSVNAMKTADGYILRDSVRNIITIDATDRFKDETIEDSLEKEEQIMMLSSASNDFIFDEQQLQNSEYATVVRSIFLRYTPKDAEEMVPPSTTIRAFYADAENNPLGDILHVDNVTWTENTAGVYESEVVFPEPVSVDLLHGNHIVEFTINGKTYTRSNVLTVSERTIRAVRNADGTPMGMQFNFDVAANPMQPALDIHWCTQRAYDMYDTYFGIKGSDGKGSQLINIVNPSNNIPVINHSSYPENASFFRLPQEDAFHNKSFYMMYGMGSVEGNRKPLVELSIIAHEYTHSVTTGCGNIMMSLSEPGALNEAIADCMAMVVEDFALGRPSWEIGKKTSIFNANMRSFEDPWYSGSVDGTISELDARPKYYGGRYWIDGNADPLIDHGGVHTNCGVFNHLFYLLCEGAQNITNEVGQTHTIEPIGMDTMKDILFHSMMYYNTTSCDYAEIADNLMIAVEDLAQQDEGIIEKQQEQMHIAYQHVGMKTCFVPTSITSVASDAKSPYSGTYNLYGMPVDSSYKGIVIQNGKKTLRM